MCLDLQMAKNYSYSSYSFLNSACAMIYRLVDLMQYVSVTKNKANMTSEVNLSIFKESINAIVAKNAFMQLF